jgi:hypothetical protein
MLEVENDKCGVPMYKVFNDYGDLIIMTGNGLLATFVNNHVKGVPRNRMLTVGGDPGTRNKSKPVQVFRIKR